MTDVLPLGLGFDVNPAGRDATRQQGASQATTTMSQALMWPDVSITDLGLGAQTTVKFGAATCLTIGGRYDLVLADHGRADERTALGAQRSPDDLYQRYYATPAQAQTEHNFAGPLRVEQTVTPWLLLSAKASRSVRTADATERGIAADGGSNLGNSWVGNPSIAPEQHHELELGASVTQDAWHLNLAGHADFVRDYINAIRPAAKQGSSRTTALDVYRNVSARLMGVEADARVTVLRHLHLSVAAACTHGQNTEDDRALPQVPPLELSQPRRGARAGAGAELLRASPRAALTPCMGKMGFAVEIT